MMKVKDLMKILDFMDYNKEIAICVSSRSTPDFSSKKLIPITGVEERKDFVEISINDILMGKKEDGSVCKCSVCKGVKDWCSRNKSD